LYDVGTGSVRFSQIEPITPLLANREKLFTLSDSLWYRNSSELGGVSASSTYFESQFS
jgi:hypothetical protein